jgi:hypothetical protein
MILSPILWITPFNICFSSSANLTTSLWFYKFKLFCLFYSTKAYFSRFSNSIYSLSLLINVFNSAFNSTDWSTRILFFISDTISYLRIASWYSTPGTLCIYKDFMTLTSLSAKESFFSYNFFYFVSLSMWFIITLLSAFRFLFSTLNSVFSRRLTDNYWFVVASILYLSFSDFYSCATWFLRKLIY